jgi:hypothetical protein
MHFQPQNITKSPYPFGMIMPERTWTSDSVGYAFGMNGQMKDDEIYGVGNSYTAEYWQYDSRLGRRWNVDPERMVLCFESNYSVNHNSPLIFVDEEGDFPILIGILIGAGSDMLMQYTKNLFKTNEKTGKRFDFSYAWKKIDWADVAIAGAMGGILPGTGIFGDGVGSVLKKQTKRWVKYSGKTLMWIVDAEWIGGKTKFRLRIAGINPKRDSEWLRGKKTNDLIADGINTLIGGGLQELDNATGVFSDLLYGKKWGFSPSGSNFGKYYLGNQVTMNTSQQFSEGILKGAAYLGYKKSNWYSGGKSSGGSYTSDQMLEVSLPSNRPRGGSGMGQLHFDELEKEGLL